MSGRRDDASDWTPDRIAELRAHWYSGVSTKKGADAMGITKNAFVNKAHRLELPARPSPIKPRKETPPPAKRAPKVAAVVVGAVRDTGVLTCQWPMWSHAVRADQRFCGAPAKRIGERRWPYCSGCCRKAYTYPIGEAA